MNVFLKKIMKMRMNRFCDEKIYMVIWYQIKVILIYHLYLEKQLHEFYQQKKNANYYKYYIDIINMY